MNLSGLTSVEQSLYDQIKTINLETLKLQLLQSENTSDYAIELLKSITNIITMLGKVWNAEHDLQGKLTSTTESVSHADIELFLVNVQPLFEMIRSRLPILRSEKTIAFGTLVNKHTVSELLELQVREKGYLTYFFGVELTTDKIATHLEQNPANILVLSCMGVNSNVNCFEELRKLRETYPNLKILVGGPAFQMFLVLKEDPNHPALTIPYKEHSYYEKIMTATNLKDFVKKEFSVLYCETLDEILEELSH